MNATGPVQPFLRAVISAAAVASACDCLAQPDRLKAARAANLVTVELIVGREGVGVRAQNWSRMFEKKGLAVTIRGETFGDKVSVSESKLSTGRVVKVIGRLDMRGDLVFPDRKFTEADAARFFQWVEDLRLYGAQGNPEGEPLWGLSKSQFGVLHTGLTAAVARDLAGLPLAEAFQAMNLPAENALHWSEEARDLQAAAEESIVTQQVKGVSKGTALAALLNESGLAFRPLRRQDSRIDLQIVPLKEGANVWPVGWPLRKPMMETAPSLFQFTQISLMKVELASVLEAASEKVKLPLLIDTHRLEAQKIDLSTVKVSYPTKKSAWILAIKELTFQAKARTEVWLDEGGNPFLWITANNAPRREGADPPIAPPGKNAVK